MAACHPLHESARLNDASLVHRPHAQLPIAGKVAVVLSGGGTSCPGREGAFGL